MKVPFRLVFKFLDENCKKINLNKEKAENTLNFLIKVVGIEWFNDQYSRREKHKNPLFYTNPLIIDSNSPIETGLQELYLLGKYLRFYQKDKNFNHILDMIKSEEIDEYYSVVLQLKIGFFISLSKGKNIELEPQSNTNPADISFKVSENEYVAEVSVLRETQVKNYLEKSIHLLLEAIHLKKYPGLQIVIKLNFKDRCYEVKLPNLFAELNKDIKLVINKTTSGIINKPFAIVSEYYTLEISPFHKNEPSMPFIIENGEVVNFIKNWDTGNAIKLSKLREGVSELEKYEDLTRPRDDTEVKLVSKFPELSLDDHVERLKKKIQQEFYQLRSFVDIGKIVFIGVDDIYFRNIDTINKRLKGFIKGYKQLTSVVLIRNTKLKYSAGGLSCIVIENEYNKYRLPQKFYKLLQSK